MILGSDALAIVKKIFLVSEESTRLSGELKDLLHDVRNHEVRLAVIGSTLAIAQRSSSLILPATRLDG